ncbi:MAG: hypothetical protein ACODAU_08695 [Myxococcota bacterium]
MTWLRPRAVALLLAPWVLVGCSDRERTEAELLVEAASAVDVRQRGSELQQSIERMEALSLETEAVRAVRDTCVRGYRLLAEAEEKQERVRGQIERAERAKANGEKQPLSTGEVRRLGQELGASLDGTREAGERINRCQAEVARLASEHGLRD